MLNPDALKKIDQAIAKYPPGQKQSAVMAALTVAQDEKGHLSPQVMDFVASYLGMAPIAVYEVASFYAMYDLKPVGKNKLCIDWNETTADGRFTLKEGECFGACGDAPVVLLNNKKMLSFMTPEKIDRWLAEAK